MSLGLPSRAGTANTVASPSPSNTLTYKIWVRQQPVAARSCAPSEHDRRVIDPIPIVQLSIEDATPSPDEISSRRFVVYCYIWNEEHDREAMPENCGPQKLLMGDPVASPFIGKDDKGEEGCFFCFTDLRCRKSGCFRLKFALVVIDPIHMQKGAPIHATAFSDIFTVYNGKEFPGMRVSTPLTKALKDQGCWHGGPAGGSGSGSGGGGYRPTRMPRPRRRQVLGGDNNASVLHF